MAYLSSGVPRTIDCPEAIRLAAIAMTAAHCPETVADESFDTMDGDGVFVFSLQGKTSPTPPAGKPAGHRRKCSVARIRW